MDSNQFKELETKIDQVSDKFDAKFDKINETLGLLVRVDERIVSLFKRMDMYDDSLKGQGARIGELEKKVHSSAWVERVIWVVVAAGIAAVVKLAGA
jgi:hypothetical protein